MHAGVVVGKPREMWKRRSNMPSKIAFLPTRRSAAFFATPVGEVGVQISALIGRFSRESPPGHLNAHQLTGIERRTTRRGIARQRKIDRTAHTRPKMSARSTFKQEHPLGAFVDAAREPG